MNQEIKGEVRDSQGGTHVDEEVAPFVNKGRSSGSEDVGHWDRRHALDGHGRRFRFLLFLGLQATSIEGQPLLVRVQFRWRWSHREGLCV